MKKALFSGTFNPPTLGHQDIIQRAAKLCGTLYVGIAENVLKSAEGLSVKEKKEMLGSITKGIPNIQIVSFSTLLVNYARDNGIDLLIRSVRGPLDLEREYAMAVANKQMSGLETIFLLANPAYEHISSSLAREIATFGGSLNGFVPKEIEGAILKKLCRLDRLSSNFLKSPVG